MIPYYQQPTLQTHRQPQQSQGFQPVPFKPRPQGQQPTSYPQTAQPPAHSFSQQYQSYAQYRQQHPQSFSQQPSQAFTPQRQYGAQPQPTPVHQAPTSYASNQSSQLYNTPQPPVPRYPSAPLFSHSQPHPGPVVPPLRANSQSPDKGRRPLPDPATPTGSPRPRPISMPPTYITIPRAQVKSYSAQPEHTPPHASSSSIPQISHPVPQTQSFQAQHQHHPHSTPPQQSYNPIPHNQTTPNNARSAQGSSTHAVESPTARRPLPPPPGGAAPHSSQPTPGDTPATPPALRRTLPFSPTQSPSVLDGMNSRGRTFPSPERGSPLSNANSVSNGRPGPSGARDSSEISRPLVTRNTIQPISTSISHSQPRVAASSAPAQPAPAPSNSRTPPTQQTRSLAFRLAALSLQEEQVPKQPARDPPPPPPKNWRRFKPNSTSPLVRSQEPPVVNLNDAPPAFSMRRPSSGLSSKPVSVTLSRPPMPTIVLPGGVNDDDEEDEEEEEEDDDDDDTDTDTSSRTSMASGSSTTTSAAPSSVFSDDSSITVSPPPSFTVTEASADTASQTSFTTYSEATPSIMVSEPTFPSTSSISSIPDIIVADLEGTLETSVGAPVQKRKGLICYGCDKGIVGRIVSAMGGRWHPACFRCSFCGELLEHVSSYEHDGKPYCHLDYHEKFAPKCYHCRTPIIDERFITLDDPALGKRTYHEQHFFCAECGDPFLAPTIPRRGRGGGSEAEVLPPDDDVGFTVYKGHPYCEACHVRLRYPKCKRCKKSIRDGMQAIEALGGKWCWECFLCAGCEKPFDDPAFFQRDNKPYCEPCFSLIIKNEI